MNSPKTAANLFVQQYVPEELTKVAGEVALPDDPSMWEEEIIQEVHKQAPYVADFDIDVVLDKADAEKGYGFGHLDVSNKSDMNTGASPEALAAGGVRTARIVVIINNKKLQPLDTLVTADAHMLPLTESRLRQSLFRPEIFDVTSKTPGDQSLLSALYPPFRNASSFGGSGMVFPAGDSFAKQGSLLERITPTMNTTDYVKIASEIKAVSSQIQGHNAEAFNPALTKLAKFDPTRFSKIANRLDTMIRPTVGQIIPQEDGTYLYKAASHLMWEPETVTLNRGQVYQYFGEKIALEADMKDGVTMVEGASEPAFEQEEEPKLITEFGLYKVMTTEGKEIIGFVFPSVLDYDGTLVPLALFVNGSESALQGEIVGNRVGSGSSIIEGEPRGYGVFIMPSADGKSVATTPIDISAHIMDGDERIYSGVTFDSQQLRIRQSPGVRTPVATGDNECVLPSAFKWCSLDKADAVKLVGNSDENVAKQASLLQRTAYLRSSGPDSYSLVGLEKEAYDLTQQDVMFLLGGYGLTTKYAQKKMAEAYQWSRPVEIHPLRNIQYAEDVRNDSQKTASKIVENIPNFRQVLVKEAAFIPDPLAVDTILSLGFINPENIQTFLSYLPQLEQTQSKMCELLVAVRLGLSNVPVGAVERVVRSLETVLEGLKVMAFNE